MRHIATKSLLQQVKVPDKPAVPGMPAAAFNMIDVGTVVLGRRNDEDAAFTTVTVEAAREVDRPGTEHDSGVGQRQVPRAGGSPTQAGDETANGRVSSPPDGNELRRKSDRLRRRN